MKSPLYIGVDISKATLDVSILAPSCVNTVHYHQFANQHKGFVQLLHWIEHNSEGIKQKDWHICMENTGMYSLQLNCFLDEKHIHQYVKNALQIKHSMGGGVKRQG